MVQWRECWFSVGPVPQWYELGDHQQGLKFETGGNLQPTGLFSMLPVPDIGFYWVMYVTFMAAVLIPIYEVFIGLPQE
jgi:hypothetical protein